MRRGCLCDLCSIEGLGSSFVLSSILLFLLLMLHRVNLFAKNNRITEKERKRGV